MKFDAIIISSGQAGTPLFTKWPQKGKNRNQWLYEYHN
jgi:hypothetical protein